MNRHGWFMVALLPCSSGFFRCCSPLWQNAADGGVKEDWLVLPTIRKMGCWPEPLFFNTSFFFVFFFVFLYPSPTRGPETLDSRRLFLFSSFFSFSLLRGAGRKTVYGGKKKACGEGMTRLLDAHFLFFIPCL
ncbi:hypothetical protein GGI35DRAFT_210255 [Trichoderma velutinum]